MADKNKYWEGRGSAFALYKQEEYYTITPIGYYVLRREEIIKHLDEVLSKMPANSDILDFGCGDGYYSILFKQKYPELNFYGCDISKSMISKAWQNTKQKRVDCSFQVNNDEIPFQVKFDLIFSIAVFAHILEKRIITTTINSIYDKLKIDGLLFLNEQTSSKLKSGKTWTKRPASQYLSFFSSFEFVIIKNIFFPNYMHIVRYILYLFVYVFFAGNFIRANNTMFFQKLSIVLMKITKPFNRILKTKEGNTTFILKKTVK
jgi:SAM-dependent methyltransferase